MREKKKKKTNSNKFLLDFATGEKEIRQVKIIQNDSDDILNDYKTKTPQVV